MRRFKRRSGALTTCALLFALPLCASSVRIYITNSAGDRVHVIDPATNKVVDEIKGIEIPSGVDFSPTERRFTSVARVRRHWILWIGRAVRSLAGLRHRPSQ